MTWKHILAGACGFILGYWLLTSRDIVLLPRYEVLVTDASDHGFPQAAVLQTRQDLVISGLSSSSISTTDAYGRAAFSAIKGNTSPLRRFIFCVKIKKAHGLHSPCGYFQQITADVPGYIEATRSETDLPLKGRGRLLHITMSPASPKP